MSHACVTRCSFTMGVTAPRSADRRGYACVLQERAKTSLTQPSDRHTLKSRNATLALTGYRALTIYEPENTCLMMWKRISDKCSLMFSLSLFLSAAVDVRLLRASLFALWRCRVRRTNNSKLLALDRYCFCTFNVVGACETSSLRTEATSTARVYFVSLMCFSNRTSIVRTFFKICDRNYLTEAITLIRPARFSY